MVLLIQVKSAKKLKVIEGVKYKNISGTPTLRFIKRILEKLNQIDLNILKLTLINM